MPDITMCKHACPKHKTCYRYIARPSEYQSYFSECQYRTRKFRLLKRKSKRPLSQRDMRGGKQKSTKHRNACDYYIKASREEISAYKKGHKFWNYRASASPSATESYSPSISASASESPSASVSESASASESPSEGAPLMVSGVVEYNEYGRVIGVKADGELGLYKLDENGNEVSVPR